MIKIYLVKQQQFVVLVPGDAVTGDTEYTVAYLVAIGVPLADAQSLLDELQYDTDEMSPYAKSA